MAISKTLALVEVPGNLTKKQAKTLRKAAEKRLGPEYRVMVLSGGITCKIIPSFGK